MKIFFNFKEFFKEFFRNISRIYFKYFPKSNQKGSGCGLCLHPWGLKLLRNQIDTCLTYILHGSNKTFMDGTLILQKPILTYTFQCISIGYQILKHYNFDLSLSICL